MHHFAAVVCMLTLASAAAAGGGSASAMVRSLPTKIEIPAQAHPGANDPNRCVAYAFASFPDVARATNHVLSYFDEYYRSTFTKRLLPPFDDAFSWGPARFNAPAGQHWSARAGFSTGQGCARAVAQLDGRFKDARVTVRVLHRGRGIEGKVLDAKCRPVRRRVALTARGEEGRDLPHRRFVERTFSKATGEYRIDLQDHPVSRDSAVTIAARTNAYAAGTTVAFRGSPGRHISAHEAAHIVQQRAGVVKLTCDTAP